MQWIVTDIRWERGLKGLYAEDRDQQQEPSSPPPLRSLVDTRRPVDTVSDRCTTTTTTDTNGSVGGGSTATAPGDKDNGAISGCSTATVTSTTRNISADGPSPSCASSPCLVETFIANNIDSFNKCQVEGE